ncbi:Nuclear-interacting partner of ALK [Bienertia sinuspersici]
MREEVISSGGTNNNGDPTPAASSAGASSPAVPSYFGGTDGSGHGPGSKTGSQSAVGTQPLWTSLSTSAGGSALGSSQPSCRPWERGDLLRRLATFKPGNWFGKPKAASSLSCARRGWVNIGIDNIECETCGANLNYVATVGWMSSEADGAAEEFSKQLDLGHTGTCPWRGNSCPDSLVQFPPTPPPALIGGYKDRCDGLLQFAALPVVAASAIELMHNSHGPQIDRFLVNAVNFLIGEPSIKPENVAGLDSSRDEAFSLYSRAQKLIALCGWEPRWLPDIQDCEDHSAQSARNGYSIGLSLRCGHPNDPGPTKRAFSSTAKKDSYKNEVLGPESKCESRSPLLDCSLCGATVRIWDFITVSRPVRVTPNGMEIPETSKKMVLTRGVSAASGISGWVGTNCMEKEQTEYNDEAATIVEGKLTSNTGVDLNLTMAGGLSSGLVNLPDSSQQYRDADLGKDLMIGQPSNSEVGDRAASYESRGPSTRKRSLDEGGSTVDRPVLRMQRADSVEGTVIDRDVDEVDDGKQYLAGPSKRAREPDVFERCGSSFRRDSSGAGPSNSHDIEVEADERRIDASHGNDLVLRFPGTRDSTHASSVIAMDTICHSADDDSMESVENFPGDVDDINCPSGAMPKIADVIDTSDLNNSNQAQQSVCFQPAVARVGGEMGTSSTNDDDEVLNIDTVTVQARDGPSIGVSGGSVGMGASHEAEIHGTDNFVNRSDSGAGDVEPIAEVVENQGQTGEFAPEHGSRDDIVAEINREDPHGDSQDVVSQSMGRADSGSKVVGSTKAESFESGEKYSEMQPLALETSVHPSLSCNAIVYSGIEASKEEVSQGGKQSPAGEGACPESEYMMTNGIGHPNGASNFEGVEFDPIKHHNSFCPWVNGDVAAAGCSIGANSSQGAVALCGWQLTLDALDTFQSIGHIPVQAVESESAASLYKC